MGMDDVPYQLTVARLNEMIAPLVGQTIPTCRRALEEAGVSASELSAVLMRHQPDPSGAGDGSENYGKARAVRRRP